MDPLTVLTTVWRHKWVTLPIVVLTMAACLYVYLYAPRTYEADVSYALTAPDVPSNLELERDPDLAKLNSNNPYLRSNDSSLLAQVVITKLSDPAYLDQLKEAGFGTDFKIAPVASLGMGLVTVTATSPSEAEAVGTAKLVGEQFTSTLNSVQKVNGADDRYLYSPILVRGPGPAKELFSNRLRSLIMVGIAGSVLLFGSVSVARARMVRRRQNADSADGDNPSRTSRIPSETGPTGPEAPVRQRKGRRANTTISPPESGTPYPESPSVPGGTTPQGNNDKKDNPDNHRLITAGRTPGD
ncbi:chain-length determining protein [Arthrobacter sp. ISL-85]|uniref:chain-length determining protein n=1 Tax=Arthrobacter sp. ISL-85 TaxID=2819115 RepID=UPI001BEC60D7|nr:chain-length determining protein [Arthrobacter sp. ISL-85]MBT2567574.1 chain-length determining protein [Arthrobacter sp. ISL-85]